jgi:hypothetical protein
MYSLQRASFLRVYMTDKDQYNDLITPKKCEASNDV